MILTHEECRWVSRTTEVMKKTKRPRDVSQLAKMMVDIASGEVREGAESPVSNKKHVGGKKGGMARAKVLSQGDRSEIARLGAMARWKKSN